MRPRRRLRTTLIGAGAAPAAMLALVVAGPQPATASAGGTRADQHTVRSGDARFEVLSPTLIRMEYAGDGTFTDAATFNAIGRDGFRPTPFTEKVSGGWLTIRTDHRRGRRRFVLAVRGRRPVERAEPVGDDRGALHGERW